MYGKTVRVGPNEISFADGSVINELYGQSSNFMKAAIYDDFSLHPVGVFQHEGKRKSQTGTKITQPRVPAVQLT
jgi:hypothetical protein